MGNRTASEGAPRTGTARPPARRSPQHSPRYRRGVPARLDEWKHELKPDGPYQQWFAHRAVAASVRADRARLHIDAWLCRQAERAGGEGWDIDRTAEVEALARGLAREPGPVAAELRRSLHGCRWLADQLRDLAVAHARAPGDDGGAAPLC